MKIINCEQGSEDWLKCRLGKVTASRFKDVIAKGLGGKPSKTRQSYMYEIASEILTETPQEVFTNQYMEWGTLTEPLAREHYSQIIGLEVSQVGFVEHNDFIGCSPDGIVSGDGLLEIKCPKTSTHIEYVLSGEFPSQYKSQVQGQLWVCQKNWCDFVSFDPRIKTKDKIFKIRVERDEQYIKMLDEEVSRFVFELENLIQRFA